MSKFKKPAIDAVLKAGSYIKKNVGKIKTVRYKGEINAVTDVDRKAEEIIVSIIRRAYPDHDFLAEEEKYKNKNSDYTWIIDPIDGTTNFIHGFFFFCVSAGLSFKGDIIFGAVYDPIANELFYAEKDKGAFLNKKRIHTSKIKSLNKSLLSTGFAYNVKTAKDNNIDNFEKFLKKAQAVRRPGSAALDLCYVACGRFDGFWELDLHPWDTAASICIVKEAGGKVTQFNGSKYSIFDKKILASNSKIHSQMSKILSR